MNSASTNIFAILFVAFIVLCVVHKAVTNWKNRSKNIVAEKKEKLDSIQKPVAPTTPKRVRKPQKFSPPKTL